MSIVLSAVTTDLDTNEAGECPNTAMTSTPGQSGAEKLKEFDGPIAAPPRIPERSGDPGRRGVTIIKDRKSLAPLGPGVEVIGVSGRALSLCAAAPALLADGLAQQ
jgi:hypothetical protein